MEVWQLVIELSDEIYIIAEGPARQSDPEQTRFIGYAHQSLIKVAACLILMKKRTYIEADIFDEL